MAFHYTPAPVGLRDRSELSADNSLPDRFALIDLIRRAAPLIGLKPPVLATLDALLSCLPPRRNHHMVFASNQTLAFRRDGISDRTLRRHFAQLEDLGFLTRHDSPNGKRFARHDHGAGVALRFGLDLSPLFAKVAQIRQLAEEAGKVAEHLAYLRMKLRAAITRALNVDPESPAALSAQPLLRRKLSNDELLAALDTLRQTTPQDGAPAPEQEMSATDSQNVRHHQKSKKELIEKDRPQTTEISIPILLETCPEAAEFAIAPIQTPMDIMDHASTLAPMMGIDRATYSAALRQSGAMPCALTVWLILALGPKVQKAGAYFRALLLGDRRTEFDPWQVILRLHRRGRDWSKNCPRTTT